MIPQFFYGSTIYYMANLRHGWEHYFTYMLVMVLENFVGIGLGMVLSASLKSVEMAPQIAPAVVIVFLMFSGFFLRVSFPMLSVKSGLRRTNATQIMCSSYEIGCLCRVGGTGRKVEGHFLSMIKCRVRRGTL